MTPATANETSPPLALPRSHAPTHPRSSHWRDIVLAISVAHFCLIQAWHGLLFERSFGYFNRIPVNRASVGALLINILVLGGLLWLIGRWAQWVNRSGLWTTINLAVCAAALVPLNFARTHFWNLSGGEFAAMMTEPLVIMIAAIAVIGAVWLHRYVARVIMGLYLVLSPMVLFTAGKSAWLLVSPPPQVRENGSAETHRPAQIETGTRVVWILLDELDQRVAFESRPANVAMPELTRLYNECFRATNAFPPGGSTMYALPALTIGQQVRGARPAGAGELTYNGSARWSEAETVFSRARSLGFSTALVGWYHPYGRVLANDLDRCEWFAYPPFEEERGHTLREAALNQLCSVFSQLQQRRLHIRNLKASEAAALNFLTNSPSGLTLLHLPVPHLPGIYDPERDRLTLWKYSRSREYLDNLTLADQLFGKLRRAMEQSGAWDKTWVILSADHWWREAVGYDGKTDHRVPFIVKGPGQNEPATYGRKFNTIVTYHLILSVLKGELSHSRQLPQWLNAFRSDPPPDYTRTGEPL